MRKLCKQTVAFTVNSPLGSHYLKGIFNYPASEVNNIVIGEDCGKLKLILFSIINLPISLFLNMPIISFLLSDYETHLGIFFFFISLIQNLGEFLRFFRLFLNSIEITNELGVDLNCLSRLFILFIRHNNFFKN